MTENCHRIGFWFWETEELPSAYRPASDLLDEVWVATDYVAAAVRSTVSKPVHVCPIPLRRPDPAPASRADLGLPEGFVFLFMFDFLSNVHRKNPIGLVDAFCRAFRPGRGPDAGAEVDQRRTLARAVRSGSRGSRRAFGCHRDGPLPSRTRARRAHERVRLLRLAPSFRGLRPHARRSDGAGEADDRHRVLRQHGVHDAGEQLPRSVAAREGAIGLRALPERGLLGGAGPGRSGVVDAAGVRRSGPRSRSWTARARGCDRSAVPGADRPVHPRAAVGHRGCAPSRNRLLCASRIPSRRQRPSASLRFRSPRLSWSPRAGNRR